MNMQKYFLLGTLIAIMPNYVFGESARYNQLVAEKQRKMEELEKCSGDVNGWKIAGISTIGLTAVGVAGNIVLANKQSSLDKDIDRTKEQIEATNNKIFEKNMKIAEEKEQQKSNETPKPVEPTTESCKLNNKTYTHGTTENTKCSRPDDTNYSNYDFNNAENCDYKCNDGKWDIEIKTCIDEYKVEGNKCVQKSEDKEKKTAKPEVKDGADCTETVKANDSSVTKAVMNSGKCEVTECVNNKYKVNADKTGCEPKESYKAPKGTCVIGNQPYDNGYSGILKCSFLPNASEFANASSCSCKCVNGNMDCKVYKCISSEYKLVDGKCVADNSTGNTQKTNNNVAKSNAGTGNNQVNLSENGTNPKGNSSNWSVNFQYGLVEGVSYCEPSMTQMGCWCQLTRINNKSIASAKKIFLLNTDKKTCNFSCSLGCAKEVSTSIDFRGKLYP